MPSAHTQTDIRTCGGTTIVVGQSFVYVNGKLWAVEGDPDNHGHGELIASQSFVLISGIPAILDGDSAAPDDLCPVPGGPHCSPSAAAGDSLVQVG